MTSDSQQNNAQTNVVVKSPKAKKKRTRKRQIVCQVCHRSFPELTAEHLRGHGFTLTRYRRAYSGVTRAPGTQSGSLGTTDDPNTLTVLDLAQRIVTDPTVIRDLAGEVTEAIFSTSLREQLRLSLVSTIAQRLDSHGKATAALNEVRNELTQRWRIAQGGENGKPTPTKELVSLHQALNIEVRQTEDLLTKTVKMAIDEFRSQKGTVNVGGGLDPLRFTGSGEALPIPADVGPGDREAIRQLWGMFDTAISERRTLDAEHTPAVHPSVAAEQRAEDESADAADGEVAENPPAEHLPDDEHSDSDPFPDGEPF